MSFRLRHAVCGALLLAAGCVIPEPVVVKAPPPVPPLQVEVVPVQPGPGHIWIAGHWAWRGPERGYVWVPGHWEVPRSPAYVWVPGHWEPQPGGYVWLEGHWRVR